MKQILKKLHLIMLDVNYIQKDKKNTHHGYTYASELAIKTAVGEALRKHGVIFYLETFDPVVEPVSKATLLKCRYKFYDVESGECLPGEFISSGPSRDDKGLWAATTNAIKYIFTSTFLIPTGDDAESETNHPAPDAAPKTAKPAAKSPAKSTAKSTKSTAAASKAAWFKEFKFLCKATQPEITIPAKPAIRALCENMLQRQGLADIAAELNLGLPDSVTLDSLDAPEWAVLTEMTRRMMAEGSLSAAVDFAILDAKQE